MTREKITRLEQVEEFLQQHAQIINTALAVYARNMKEESENALAGYRAIENDPYARAKQDGTVITTDGLLQSSQILMDAAGRATSARIALENLEEE